MVDGEDWLIEAAPTLVGDLGVNSLAYLWASFGDAAVPVFELGVRVNGAGGVAVVKTGGSFATLGTLGSGTLAVDGSRRVRLAVRGQRVTAWAETAAGFVVVWDVDVAVLLGEGPPVAVAVSGQVEGPALSTETTISCRAINGWRRAAR